jgi:N-acetylneuraminic acid mutarotase
MSDIRPPTSGVRARVGLLVGALLAGLLLHGGASAQGRWTNGAPMPSERTEVAAAEVAGQIYVVGGFGGQLELEIYDPAADRWRRGRAFPHAVHHAAAVGLNGKLYVVGGFVDGWSPSDAVFVYDPAVETWRALAAMPTPRGALAAAVIDGRIYAVSGVGPTGRNTVAHEAYDPGNNRWTVLASVPTPRGPSRGRGAAPTALRHRRPPQR